MENTNVAIAEFFQKHPKFDDESEDAYRFRVMQEVGVFQLLSITRDIYLQKAESLRTLIPTSLDEVKMLNDLRNKIINCQTYLDAAYRFEQIVETGDFKVQ